MKIIKNNLIKPINYLLININIILSNYKNIIN